MMKTDCPPNFKRSENGETCVIKSEYHLATLPNEAYMGVGWSGSCRVIFDGLQESDGYLTYIYTDCPQGYSRSEGGRTCIIGK